MARPRLGNGDRLVAVLRRWRHFFRPIFPVAVLDAKRDGRTAPLAPADARADRRLILLDQHPTAAAVALLPPPQVMIDMSKIEGKARGDTIDNGGEARSMRFPRGKIAQH